MTEETGNAKSRLSPKKVQEEMTEKLDKVVASTNSALEAVDDKIEDIDSKMDTILDAINNPSFIRKTTEAAEQRLGHEPVREPTINDNGDCVIEPANFGDVNSPEFKSKADNLRFMNEIVTVHISDTAEKNADQVFDVAVNGSKVTFIRGHEFKVKRMFIEGLARAKPVTYGNEEYQTANGDKQYRHPTKSGLRYPFSIAEDKNPNGASWLKRVLAEA